MTATATNNPAIATMTRRPRGRPDQNRRPFSMWVIPEAGGVGGVLEVGLGDSPVEGAGGGGDGDGTGGGGLGGGADCNVSFR